MLLLSPWCSCPAWALLPPCAVFQGTPHTCPQLWGLRTMGKQLWHFEEWGGRREAWWLSSQPPSLTPSLTSCCLETRVGVPGWAVILPSSYLPSLGNMVYPPPSQSRAVLTQMFSEVELLSTSVGGFCCFSLNIYIGATHWNIQMYTQITLKQEETASPTPSISLFSCCSREKPKYMSGRVNI